MRAIASLVTVICLLAPVGLAACGDDDDDQSAEPAATTTAADEDSTAGVNRIDLSSPASGELVFEPDHATAKAGELTIVWENEADVEHDICLEDEQGRPVLLYDQQSKSDCSSRVKATTITDLAKVKPGEYTYYCSVDGHREAGMEGTLTVE